MPDRNTRAISFFAVKCALIFGFVALGLTYAWDQKDALRQLDWPSPFPIVLVAIAFVASVGFRSTYNWLVARHLGAGMSQGESFMLSSVVSAGNILLPIGAGAALRAIYMKRVHNFPVAYFASGVLVFMIVNIIVVSLVAALVMCGIYLGSGELRVDVLAGFLLLAIVVAAAVLLARRGVMPPAANRVSWWSYFRSGVGMLISNRRMTVVSIVIVSMNYLIASITWTVALRDYVHEIAVLEAFLISASQIISGFVSLTPGGAGFQELAGIYVGHSFAATTVQLFAVLIWVRIVRMATAALVAVPAFIILRTKLKSKAV